MACSPQEQIVLDMAGYGLFQRRPPKRCQLCRKKSDWTADNDRYCFMCICAKNVSIVPPPSLLMGKLTSECDHRQPTFNIKQVSRRGYAVVSEDAQWRGAIMDVTDFESIEPSRMKVFLDGVQIFG